MYLPSAISLNGLVKHGYWLLTESSITQMLFDQRKRCCDLLFKAIKMFKAQVMYPIQSYFLNFINDINYNQGISIVYYYLIYNIELYIVVVD